MVNFSAIFSTVVACFFFLIEVLLSHLSTVSCFFLAYKASLSSGSTPCTFLSWLHSSHQPCSIL